MKSFSAGFLVVLFCFLNLRNAKAQVVVLDENEFVKVDAVVNAKVRLYQTVDSYYLADNTGERDWKKDHITLFDSVSVFYLWRPNGVFQIFTKKYSENLVKKTRFKKKYKFKDLWNEDYLRSFEKINDINKKISCQPLSGEGLNIGKQKRDWHYKREAILNECDFPILINSSKGEQQIYSLVSVIFYNYPVEEINNAKEVNQPELFNVITADRFYAFVSLASRFLPPGKNKKPNADLTYMQDSWLHRFYLDLGVNLIPNVFPEYLDFAIPFISKGILNNWEDADLRTFITQDGPITGSLKQIGDHFESELDTELLKNENCNYGYILNVNRELYNQDGMMVIPQKFFLPSSLQIVSVNDIPWETYKKQLCEK